MEKKRGKLYVALPIANAKRKHIEKMLTDNKIPLQSVNAIHFSHERQVVYITMPSIQMAETAADSLNHCIFRGQEVTAQLIPDPACTLWVGDIPKTVSSATLMESFSQWGNVVHVNLVRHPFSQQSEGHAYITYDTPVAVEAVIQMCRKHFFVFQGSPRPVRVDFIDDSHWHDPFDLMMMKSDFAKKESPPHFVANNDLEDELARKWMVLSVQHKAERDKLQMIHQNEKIELLQEQEKILASERQKLEKLEDMFKMEMKPPATTSTTTTPPQNTVGVYPQLQHQSVFQTPTQQYQIPTPQMMNPMVNMMHNPFTMTPQYAGQIGSQWNSHPAYQLQSTSQLPQQQQQQTAWQQQQQEKKQKTSK